MQRGRPSSLNIPNGSRVTKSPIADEDILAVLAALAPLGGSRVLELGCGLGKFSVYLALHGASVTAVDVGPIPDLKLRTCSPG